MDISPTARIQNKSFTAIFKMDPTKYLFHLSILCLWFIAVVPAPKKEGDFIVGGLFPVNFLATSAVHGPCGELNTKGLGRALSLIFAIENINNNSNILPNITLGYDIRAYCEDATEATRLIYDLIKERCCRNSAQKKMGNKTIVALIGPEESSTALAIGGFLQIFNVSGISGTTTSPELSANLNNFYRTVPSDNFRVKAMADIIEHFNWSYVAAVGIYDSYGRSGVWGLVEEAGRRNNPFCIAMTELITQESPRITDVVTKLRWRENIKVIVLWTYGNVQRMFFREVNRQNLSGRVWILSEVTFSSNENYFPHSGLSPLHGSIAFQPHNFDDGGFKQHLTGLLASGANEPNYPELWNEIKELKRICSLRKEKDISSDSDRHESCLQEIVADMYSSYIPYIIDAVHSVAHALDMLAQNFSSRQKLADVNLDNMKTILSRVNFDGLTGEIFFDEFGDRQTAVYDIVNFQQVKEADVKRLDQVIVGKWDASKRLYLQKNILLWNNDQARPLKSECSDQCLAGTRKSTTSPCCWKCVPCPRGTVNAIPGSESCTECSIGKRANKARTTCEDLPLANLSYSSAGGITILAFGAGGIIAALFSFAVFCRFWNTPIVMACNRTLSLALLVAIVLLLSLAFINLFKPTATFCKIIYPWRFLTYNLCLSIVLVKVLGISVAFKVPIVPGFAIRSLTSRIQATIVITLHVFLFFPLLFWLILDPPDNQEHIYPEQYTFFECKAYNMFVGKSLFIVTSSYIFIQMLLSAYCSFKVRNIPENFSEAKRIAFSLYILLFSMLAYYPIEFSIHGWYVSVVDCVTSLLSAYGFLCCIFLPKIYIIIFKPELNTCAMVGREVTQFSFRTNIIHVNPAVESSSPDSTHNPAKQN